MNDCSDRWAERFARVVSVDMGRDIVGAARHIRHQCFSWVAEKLPARIVASCELRFRPRLADSWGGPLNGQQHRQEIVRQLVAAIEPGQIVETGTYRGTSTEFFAKFDVPVQTVEMVPRFYEYARRRMADYANVSVHCGDSRTFIRELPPREGSVLFYLDAHWQNDLPLAEELEIINTRFPTSAVLIDDFQVPDDAGYGFDDYGPGKSLTVDILPLDGALRGWGVFYPSLGSADDTGARRGSVVLVAPPLTAIVIDRVPALRKVCADGGASITVDHQQSAPD